MQRKIADLRAEVMAIDKRIIAAHGTFNAANAEYQQHIRAPQGTEEYSDLLIALKKKVAAALKNLDSLKTQKQTLEEAIKTGSLQPVIMSEPTMTVTVTKTIEQTETTITPSASKIAYLNLADDVQASIDNYKNENNNDILQTLKLNLENVILFFNHANLTDAQRLQYLIGYVTLTGLMCEDASVSQLLSNVVKEPDDVKEVARNTYLNLWFENTNTLPSLSLSVSKYGMFAEERSEKHRIEQAPAITLR